MSGAREGHAPTSEPARTIFWIGKGRCPECQQGRERPELVDGVCPFCGWEQ
jgi:hypothetical protein